LHTLSVAQAGDLHDVEARADTFTGDQHAIANLELPRHGSLTLLVVNPNMTTGLPRIGKALLITFCATASLKPGNRGNVD
jgi:hypothetical protein